jgi:predicted transposase YbfD/YdcC
MNCNTGLEISETGVEYAKNSLYEWFGQIIDHRKLKGLRYTLVTLLAIIFLAKLSGQDNPVEIADWAKNNAPKLYELLKLKRKTMPHHNTYRRVFEKIISSEEFDEEMSKYHQAKDGEIGEVFCLDGKVLRGTQIAGVKRSDQVLSLFDGVSHRVLAQEPIETKENEIVAAPVVLERVDLTGKIVTADALHTQRKLSAQIVKDGDYVLPVKDNQQRLRENIEQLFAPENPKPGFGKIKTDFETVRQISYGHGRLEIRTIQTSEMLNEYLDWPGVKQVYRLDREFHWLRQGKVYKSSHEIEYGITSLARQVASPIKLLTVRRQHWSIEASLHYRRDVTFKEDATRMTKGKAGHILGTIHNLILSLLKSTGFTNTAQARRWYAGHLDDAFALLLT